MGAGTFLGESEWSRSLVPEHTEEQTDRERCLGKQGVGEEPGGVGEENSSRPLV